MTVLRMKESKFGAPLGVYQAKFLGVQDMEEPASGPIIGADGKAMPPGMEWMFEVTEGQYAGQIIGRITGKEPTTRNICGKLLSGLVGRNVGKEEDIDLSAYEGQVYQVVVGPHSKDPEKSYVTQIVRVKDAAKPGPAAPGKPKPPPRAEKRPELEAKYWVEWHDDILEMTGHQIFDEIKKGAVQAKDLPVMAHDKTGGWKTAEDFGLEIPF